MGDQDPRYGVCSGVGVWIGVGVKPMGVCSGVGVCSIGGGASKGVGVWRVGVLIAGAYML